MESFQFEIRNICEEDLEEILAIYNHAIINTTAVYCYEPFSIEMMKNWFQTKKERQFPVLIAENNRNICGFATYGDFRLKPAYKYTVEHSVYIAPSDQKKGIASELMRELILRAKENGIHTLIGGIDAENQESLIFHEKLGFTEVGEIKEVGYKFGKWLNLKFVQLVLETPQCPKEN